MQLSILGRSQVFLLVALALLTGFFRVAAAQENLTPETKKLLAHMDQANRELTDFSANIKQTKLILVVNDTTVDSGKVYFKKDKKGTKTKIEYEKPEPKTILIDKDKIQIYEPKINRLYEPNFGKNQPESGIFMVGFGSSDNLTRTYSAKFVKEDMVNGQKTSLLELKPKAANAMFAKVLVWVDQTRWLPAQIRLYETTGDYLTVLFENLKINSNLPDKIFKIKK
jgi:outer membrane lipoprotein-sorting protein